MLYGYINGKGPALKFNGIHLKADTKAGRGIIKRCLRENVESLINGDNLRMYRILSETYRVGQRPRAPMSMKENSFFLEDGRLMVPIYATTNDHADGVETYLDATNGLVLLWDGYGAGRIFYWREAKKVSFSRCGITHSWTNWASARLVEFCEEEQLSRYIGAKIKDSEIRKAFRKGGSNKKRQIAALGILA